MTLGIANTEEDDEERNDWGLPNVPLASITVTAAPASPQTTKVDQNIDNSRGKNEALPWLMVCAIISTLAICISLFTFMQSLKMEREYRMVQLQLTDQQALLLRDGLVQPNDVVRGPAGNLYYQPSHPKREK